MWVTSNLQLLRQKEEKKATWRTNKCKRGELLNDSKSSYLILFPSVLTNLPPFPFLLLLLLPLVILLLIAAVCRLSVCLFSYFKGTKGEKRRNHRRQNSDSTYKHTGIIIMRLQRCHDNTPGSEGGIWWHWGRDRRKEEVEWVAKKKEMEVIILGVFSCSSDGFLAEMHLDLFTDLPCQSSFSFCCSCVLCMYAKGGR